MSLKYFSDFHPSTTPGSAISGIGTGRVTLKIPAGPRGRYRLAQLDDTRSLGRGQLLWKAPLSFQVHARASSPTIPGTWGFGFWNVPLSFKLGFGVKRSLPALPNAVWFFFSSPENHLTLEDNYPPNGATAAVFRSPQWPFWILAPGALAMPLLMLRPTARLLRNLARRILQQDAVSLNCDITQWHHYGFKWQPGRVSFYVDGEEVLETTISPSGPLGFVLWIDNQFMAYPPNGKLGYGLLENNEESWIEVEELGIQQI